MKSLLINILCPLTCCQNIFVLSLNRNNFRTVVLGILVLMYLLSCFTRCGRSILVPSILSFGAIISWTFSSLPFYVSPLSLSSHQSLYFFHETYPLVLLVYSGHTLDLFGFHIFLGRHCLAFHAFFYVDNLLL